MSVGLAWGILLTALSLLAWGGQVIAWRAPAAAQRLGLMEAQDGVEPAFWADGRGEAAWDSLTLWTMPVAGGLLAADSPGWTYFGLVGGGMYVYFAGRGIFARVAMRRRGLRIGTRQGVRMGLAFLSLWGAVGLVTIIAAAVTLSTS